MKAAIDDHIQQLFDALLQSLRHSIMTSVQTIDTFLTDAKKSLSIRPQSVEEIGEVNKKHAEIAKQKPQVRLDIMHIRPCTVVPRLSPFLSFIPLFPLLGPSPSRWNPCSWMWRARTNYFVWWQGVGWTN